MDALPTGSYRYQPAPFSLTTGLLNITAGEDKVDSPCQEWLDMAARWELCHDLLGGTLQMRAAGQKWLPKEPKEEWQKYLIRLSRAVLYNGYKNAIKRIVGKPFSREIVVKGELPDQLKPMLRDVDLQGSTLTQFARKLMKDAAVHGKTHFIVEYPETGGNQTLAAEREGRIRPFFCHLPAENVIAWRKAVDPETGEEYPTMVRVRDVVQRDIGEFATERVARVRVYEPGRYRTYECDSKSREYVLVKDVTVMARGQVMTRIPIVTVYFEKEGFFEASPPLEDLAWVNLAHWQSTADQRNALRFARIGILLAKGFAPEEVEKGIEISPNMAQMSASKDADLKYVEQQGNAITAGERDLTKLEEQMEVMGVQPLIERSAASTATGKVIDEHTNDAQAQAWVRALEGGLYEGFEWAHLFAGEEIDKEFAVDVFNDFAISIKSSDDVDKLIQMRTTVPPQISHETFLLEVRRRGTLSDDVIPSVEIERIQREMMGEIPEAEEEEVETREVDLT